MYTIEVERQQVEYALARERERQRESIRTDIWIVLRKKSRVERALSLPLRKKMRSHLLHKLANFDSIENRLIDSLAESLE